MARRPDLQERHRRQREASHRRLLDVARELLEEHAWSDVSIALVTQRAGLTRTAFYKHFGDRRAMLLALWEELGAQITSSTSTWQRDRETDGRALLREVIDEIVGIFREHGRLVEAVAEEAGRDPRVGQAYREFVQRAIGEAADRIRHDMAAGRSEVTDADEVATALIWMNERYLRDRFGRHPVGDAGRAADALDAVWLCAVYGSPATRP